MKFANKLFINKRIVFILYFAFAIAASIQSVLIIKPHNYIDNITGKQYTFTDYNNYVIFKNSYNHLLANKDIYKLYLDEHWDLYKYSPTCSLFFGFFYALPDGIGLFFWNFLNAFVLLVAVYYLPRMSLKNKGLILASIVIELMTCMQNEQSNGLICGLIILAFGMLERGNYFMAILCIVFTAYIKLFGIVALSLLIFYPGKWKLALYTLFWSIFLFLLPLTVIDFSQLKFLYLSWGKLLANDHSISSGLSVAGWLKAWFDLGINKTLITVAGVVLFCLPLLRFKEYANYSFRLITLSSVLIWVVIFNHRAESPTFIIAMSGAAIWFFSGSFKAENFVLFALALIFTILSPTDIFPREIRTGWLEPYVIKAVPCILIWFKILYDQLLTKKIQAPIQTEEQTSEEEQFGLTI